MLAGIFSENLCGCQIKVEIFENKLLDSIELTKTLGN